jgi:hypothetical protein
MSALPPKADMGDAPWHGSRVWDAKVANPFTLGQIASRGETVGRLRGGSVVRRCLKRRQARGLNERHAIIKVLSSGQVHQLVLWAALTPQCISLRSIP